VFLFCILFYVLNKNTLKNNLKYPKKKKKEVMGWCGYTAVDAYFSGLPIPWISLILIYALFGLANSLRYVVHVVSLPWEEQHIVVCLFIASPFGYKVWDLRIYFL